MEKSKSFARNFERAFGVQEPEEVTEETIETKVEEIEVKETGKTDADEALDGNVGAAVSFAAKNPEQAEAVLAAEKEGKNRKGVVSGIEGQIAEREAEGEEE